MFAYVLPLKAENGTGGIPLLVDFRAESYKDGHTHSSSAHVISILSFPLQTHNILSTSGYLNAKPHQFCTNPINTCTLLTNPSLSDLQEISHSFRACDSPSLCYPKTWEIFLTQYSLSSLCARLPVPAPLLKN